MEREATPEAWLRVVEAALLAATAPLSVASLRRLFDDDPGPDLVRRLLDALRDVPAERRTARFYAVIVLLRHANDPQPLICEGSWEGRIIDELRGSNGFGYNPVFLDEELGLTAAQMEPAQKNGRSHRAKALQLLVQQLSAQLAR